jgi:hypothetical protein
VQDLLAGPFQEVVRDTMGQLNIASSGLLVGAMGQEFFGGPLFPRLPAGMVMATPFLPGLIVFFIPFGRESPFIPRPFRYCLISAMCWCVGMTLLAEALFLMVQPASYGHISLRWAFALTYLGALSFVVFIQTGIQLHRYEATSNARQTRA